MIGSIELSGSNHKTNKIDHKKTFKEEQCIKMTKEQFISKYTTNVSKCIIIKESGMCEINTENWEEN